MWELYWLFTKVGALMIGGGYAMLPLLLRELCQKREWVTEAELLDIFAVAQCTPGVIAVNTATYIGYKRGRVLGAVLATAGIITVPVILIIALALLLRQAEVMPFMHRVFAGMRVAVAALIVTALIKLFRGTVKNWLSGFLFVVSCALVSALKVNAVFIVIGAALLAVAIWGFKGRTAVSEKKRGAK